jgi:hypothetical protein
LHTGGKEKLVSGFDGCTTLKRRRIISKLDFKKWDGTALAGLLW